MDYTPTDSAQSCFDKLKEIWSSFDNDSNRVIPFCTPIIDRPTCVIVGINHSVFSPGAALESDATAGEYAGALPTRSAFIREHFHPERLSDFAEDILDVFAQVDIAIDEAWVGTNRCPVQRTKIDEIRYLPSFVERQKQTDLVMRQFLKSIAPERIVLIGKFAAELYFNGAESKSYDALKQPKEG